MRVMERLVIMCALLSCAPVCAKQPQKNQQEAPVIPLAPTTNPPAAEQHDLSVDEDTASMQRIIMTFARIAHSFFTIAASKNPKDPILLGQNLTDMAAGVINIAMEMFRSKGCIDDERETATAFTLTNNDLALLKEVIVSFKQQLARIDEDALCAPCS